ncbi:hypothetical protein AVEN_249621-1, partial [Araneus ventricosus]
SRTM